MRTEYFFLLCDYNNLITSKNNQHNILSSKMSKPWPFIDKKSLRLEALVLVLFTQKAYI